MPTTFLISALLCACLAGFGQTVAERRSQLPVPEAGFISARQYTNAFFGFSLPLLKDRHFQMVDLSTSDKAFQHSLFAYKSAHKGLSLLMVSATQVFGAPDDEAQKAAFLPGTQGQKGAQALSIGGRLFWKSEIEQKTFSGRLHRVRYATGLSGYVIQFSVSSYDSGQTEELRNLIESVKFFDPATAREVAGPDSGPFLSRAAQLRLENAPQLDIAHLDRGSVSGNVYTNPFLGFIYQLPEGWYAREGPTPGGNESEAAKGVQGTPSMVRECTKTLLSATEHPPENQARDSNPRITIMAADPTCFAPDLAYPSSVSDTLAIERLGQAIMRGFAGTVLLGRGTNRLRARELGGHLFLEMPSVASVPVAGTLLLRKVHKSLVLTSLQQYWVIWLFEGETASELNQMMKTAVSFAPSHPSAGPGGH